MCYLAKKAGKIKEFEVKTKTGTLYIIFFTTHIHQQIKDKCRINCDAMDDEHAKDVHIILAA
jgi:hypothetical protein